MSILKFYCEESEVDSNTETEVPGSEENPIDLESEASYHWWSDQEEDLEERNPEVAEILVVDFEDQWIEGNFSRPTSPTYTFEEGRINLEVENISRDPVQQTCDHPWYSRVTYKKIEIEKLEKEQQDLWDLYREEIKEGRKQLRGQTHQHSQCYKNNTCGENTGRWCVLCEKHCLLDKCQSLLNSPRRLFSCFRCGAKKHFGRNCHTPINCSKPIAVVFPMKRKTQK